MEKDRYVRMGDGMIFYEFVEWEFFKYVVFDKWGLFDVIFMISIIFFWFIFRT